MITKILRPENADRLPVVITLIDSDLEIVLYGKDLPNAGVDQESKLRYSKRYYPGQSTATLHIMGEEQEPMSFDGRFYDRRDFKLASPSELVGNLTNPLVGGPRDKANALQGAFSRQNRVRVQWGQNIDFVGVISRLKLTNFRHNVIGYSFTVDPLGPFIEDVKIRGVFDQRTLGMLMDQVDLAAGQLLDMTYRSLMIARRFVIAGSQDDAPGDLPEPLVQGAFFDLDNTKARTDTIRPGSKEHAELSSVSSTASGGGSRFSQVDGGGTTTKQI